MTQPLDLDKMLARFESDEPGEAPTPEECVRLIRMLKRMTEAARALANAVEDSAEAAAVDQNNSHDEWRTDRPTEYKAWEDMRAALAYNGEPDA